jgi:hypothetical protein
MIKTATSALLDLKYNQTTNEFPRSELAHKLEHLRRAAMLLAWLTAARPGTFTVSEGYKEGASLGMSLHVAKCLKRYRLLAHMKESTRALVRT